MKSYTSDELKEILEKHKKLVNCEVGGESADLTGADLRGADLRGAYLTGADLRGAYLTGADLRGAYLTGADLTGADLRGADLTGADLRGAYLTGADLRGAYLTGAYLTGADLRGAYLTGADLRGAYLTGADLTGADLRGADLTGADLRGADLRGACLDFPMACPDTGRFTAWKKASGFIVKLEIPEDARRSSATGRKCRCDKAKVIAIENIDGSPADVTSVCSSYDELFVYTVGETAEEPNFCPNRWEECAPGIHFFINRIEAEAYNN